MIKLKYIAFGLMCLAIAPLSGAAVANPPLKALLLTSPGVYHNYELQTQVISNAIARRANVIFDISLAELERWKTTDYATGYDVLIYNICMADNTDQALIDNMRRQTEVLGVPAMFIHCTMHSFREADYWWPILGLQTKAHEHPRALPQIQSIEHPILAGIPTDWTVEEDELYINIQFDAQALLTSTGEDQQAHVSTWLKHHQQTPVFGTTLGHTSDTLEDPIFQRLLSNALLYITGKLNDDGSTDAAYAPQPNPRSVIATVSAPQGIEFLGEEGADCVMSQFRKAVGFCYAGCIVNPLSWGDDAQACKDECVELLPSPEEVTEICMKVMNGV